MSPDFRFTDVEVRIKPFARRDAVPVRYAGLI